MPRSVIATTDAEAGTGRVIAYALSTNEAQAIIPQLMREFNREMPWEWIDCFLLIYVPADLGPMAKRTLQRLLNETDAHSANGGFPDAA
jgi:hypothetical protein